MAVILRYISSTIISYMLTNMMDIIERHDQTCVLENNERYLYSLGVKVLVYRLFCSKLKFEYCTLL